MSTAKGGRVKSRRKPTEAERDEKVSLYPWTGEEVAKVLRATPRDRADSDDKPEDGE